MISNTLNKNTFDVFLVDIFIYRLVLVAYIFCFSKVRKKTNREKVIKKRKKERKKERKANYFSRLLPAVQIML